MIKDCLGDEEGAEVSDVSYRQLSKEEEAEVRESQMTMVLAAAVRGEIDPAFAYAMYQVKILPVYVLFFSPFITLLSPHIHCFPLLKAFTFNILIDQ